MVGRRVKSLFLVVAFSLTCLFVQGVALAADENVGELEANRQPQRLVQGLLGVMKFDDDTYSILATDADGNDVHYEGKIPTMPFLGGMWQNSFMHGDFISLGGEAGVQFGFVNESTTLYAGGNGIKVKFKNRFFVANVPLGINLDLHPTNKFRIYAGAGPLLMYGYLKIETDDDASIDAASSGTSGFDIGYYGRIGTDIVIGHSTRFGFQAQYTDARLDFNGDQGRLDMRGVQYMITFTEAF